MKCILPWKHLSLNASSLDYKLCCVSTDDLAFNLESDSFIDVLNSKDLKDIRKQMTEGEVYKSCYVCLDEEKMNIESLRTISNRALDKQDLDNLKADELIKEACELELRLGNLCNLKCIMCNPENSSSFDDYQEIYGESFSGPNVLKKKDMKKFFQKFNFEKISKLIFRGGEPLINPLHLEILKHLASSGLSSSVELVYTTNLTVLDDSLLELWKSFKGINCWISLDGVGGVNDFIRYPSKFSDIIKNCEKLDQFLLANRTMKISVGFCTSIMAINIFELIKIIDLSKKFSSFIGVPFLNIVHNPSVLSPHKLPYGMVRDCLSDISNIDLSERQYCGVDIKFRTMNNYQSIENANLRRIKNYLESLSLNSKDNREIVWNHLEKISKIRSLSIPQGFSFLETHK